MPTVDVEPRRVVPDASVAVKWFVPERGSNKALALLEAAARGEISFFVPDLWYAEIVNTLWKKTRRKSGRLPVAHAAGCVEQLMILPVTVRSNVPLVPRAFAIAVHTGLTVYDALYLALAEAEEAELVTEDRELREVRSGEPSDRRGSP